MPSSASFKQAYKVLKNAICCLMPKNVGKRILYQLTPLKNVEKHVKQHQFKCKTTYNYNSDTETTSLESENHVYALSESDTTISESGENIVNPSSEEKIFIDRVLNESNLPNFNGNFAPYFQDFTTAALFYFEHEGNIFLFFQYLQNLSQFHQKKTPSTFKNSKLAYQLSINNIIWHVFSNPSLVNNMYFGLGIDSEIKSEYWHRTLWAESLQTYRCGDFVYYYDNNNNEHEQLHLSRLRAILINEVNKQYRLRIQKVLYYNDLLGAFKGKRKLKEQTRTIYGKFDKKANKNSQQLIDDNSGDVLVEEFFDENEDWDDDDNKKIKREPYKIGKTPKSTYYDKYGPSGSLTKAAAGTKKITNFFNNSDTQATDLQLFNQDTLNDILSDTDSSDSESEVVYSRNYQITEKIKDLKEQIIDGKDVAKRCHIWIRKQNFNTIPTTFRKFVENELFPAIGIAREKSITIMTTTRLKVLGYSFQQYRHGIYYDEHEKKDVLQYRKEFLENIFNHEKYMSKYEDEFMDRIYPNLLEGEKERVLVVHDECIFYSNDGKRGL
ncbi:hypothetical protein RhiirC2_786171 [Rhizophagus irregularis]|uniref:Uncharacterized protein n=1 Tax=Rhizophagus irregularis TaxID=588596 RepID=A0A2N1MV14_9GLOM|nr:hypothetical protein RhiirC2_786171 [Rhizophagus irregularis]